MKKNVLLVFILVWFYSLNFSLHAQGFSNLIEKLNILEARINSLDKSQSNNMTIFKDNLLKLEDYSKLNSEFSDVVARLDNINIVIEELKKEMIVSERNENTESLINDLKILIAELRSVLSEVGNVETEMNEGLESTAEQPLSISGFVDASYYFDVNTSSNSFTLDQVEVDIQKKFSKKGSLRADIEWINNGEGDIVPDIEQGFLVYEFFTFGKFNAPIGFELLDAPDMFQYSHALVFNYGLPTNLTGLMFSKEIWRNFDIVLYITNGWDQNFDMEKGKSVGGRLGYTSKEVGIGLSAISGVKAGQSNVVLTVFDMDLSVTPTESLLIGGELNLGTEDSGNTSTGWFGLLLMSHYQFSNLFGITGRYDFFDDKNATRFGSEVVEKRQAITIAPTFALDDGMTALLELRMDFSDKEVFPDDNGDLKKSAFGVAFEVTYSF